MHHFVTLVDFQADTRLSSCRWTDGSDAQCPGFPLPFHVFPLVLHDDIAGLFVVPDFSEPRLFHADPDLYSAHRLAQGAADAFEDVGGGDENAVLAARGLAEEAQDLFFLEVGHFEILVLLAQFEDILAVEPVVEAAFPQRPGLRVQPFVVDGGFVGAVDALHLEREPAAVAGRVGEELDVVARAAERGDVAVAFLVAPVGGPFVDMQEGGHRLQLVQLGGTHVVDLLEADEGVFAEGEEVVLVEARAVGLRVEVAAQLRGQQAVQPGGLVDALRADEDQDLVVDDVVFEKGGEDAGEPLAEVVGEPLVAVLPLDMHRCRQPSDMVGLAVPGGQRAEVFEEGVVGGRELGVEHVVDVARGRALARLVYSAPEGVAVAVGQLAELLLAGPFHFAMLRDGVGAEEGFAGEEGFDLLDRGVVRSFRSFAFAVGEGVRPVLLCLAVTGTEDPFGVARPVVGELSRRPPERFRFRYPVEIEEVARAHDVFVVVPRLVGDVFLFQQLFHGFGRLCGHGRELACRARPSRFAPALLRGLFGQLGREGGRAGVEEGIGVEGQPADALRVLAGGVVFQPREAGVVFVALPVSLLVGVERAGGRRVGIGDRYAVEAVDDADPVPADRPVGEQRVRVGAYQGERLLDPPGRDVVEVVKAQSGVGGDVLALPAALAPHGGSEGGAGSFLFGGRFLVSRFGQAAEAVGVVAEGRVGGDGFVDLRQCGIQGRRLAESGKIA